MTFRPVKSGQYEPVTSTSAKDCVAATTAMLIERATVGRLRPTHATIRKASGAPSTRGLYLYEAVNAAKTLGVTLVASLWNSRNTMRDTVAGGAAVGVTIHTSVTRYTTRRTNYYVGPHEVYVQAYNYWPAGEVCACEKKTATAHGEYSVEDPGTTSVGYLQWSADLVYRAAEKLTGGGINLLIAPDTEIRPWKAAIAGQIRSEPDYDTGRKLADIVLGRTYKGGRTENGGNWLRADGSKANGWTHVVISGTTPETYKWGWWAGRAGRQA